MSEQTIQRTSRIADSQTAMPWLVAAGVYLLLMTLAPRLLADPDTYSHIAMGRWILEHHTVPTTDPFTQTFRGEHWIAFEWLAEIVYAIAQSLGGWLAVAVLTSVAAAAAFGLLTRFLLREWPAVPVLIAVLAALVLVAPHILARPHMLALPLIVAWIALLIRTVDDRQAPPWQWLPLMTLWANLHASFTFGLGMIGVVAIEALWNASQTERLKLMRQWTLFGVLALAAACFNPYGPEMILVTIRTIALGHALSVITEWRPQDFTHLGPFEIVMLAGFGAVLYRGIKLPPLRILMLFGVLHLSLSQSRHADLLGLLAPIFLARPLAEYFGSSSTGPSFADRRIAAWAPAIAGLFLIVATALAATRHDIVPAANITPAKAVQSLDIAKAGPVLNDYDFGGYLDFVGIAPFIDGRSELFGAEFVVRYDRALKLQNLPDFLRLLEEHKIATTLLAPTTPAVALMDRLPNWQRVYSDDIAVVHARHGAPASHKN